MSKFKIIIFEFLKAAKIQQRIAEETKNIDIVERLKQIEIQEQEILRYNLHSHICVVKRSDRQRSWTENVELWRIFLGFIWDIWNVLMIYNYWVWAQIRRSKSSLGVTFRESIFFLLKLLNFDDKKFYN